MVSPSSLTLTCTAAYSLHAATHTLQVLLDLAVAGDEARARERIAFLKRAVDGGHTRANDRPYVAKGAAPAGVDVAQHVSSPSLAVA